MTLSLCMIVKNEEKTLARCLDSVNGVFDEIVIVDTGSSDKTKEIAKRFTDKVYDFKWIDDFAAARNFSFSKASSDYIMWLDADDVLTEESRKELIELKRKFDFKTDIYFLKYRMGKESDFVFYRERIFKQNKNYKWISPIHEVIEPSGNICYSDIEILHEKINTEISDRNLKIFLKMKKEGQPFDSRQKYYFARELYYHKRYEEAEEVLKDFLREGGFYENEIEGIKLLAELYLLKNNRKEALKTLFTTFYYGEPKGEICVLLGNIYVDIGEYTKAIKCYKEALRKKPDLKGGGFCNLDCYGYIPCVQLCVCHYRLGNVGQAVKYNNLALKYKPDGESAIFNRRFFEMRRQNNKKWLVKKPEL